MTEISTVKSSSPPSVNPFGFSSKEEPSSTLPPANAQKSGGSQVNEPIDPTVLDNPSAAEQEAVDVIAQWDELATGAAQLLGALKTGDVNIDQILIEISKLSQADQRESFLLSKTSIEFNRNMRERIYELVQKLNEEVQKLEQEVKDLEQEIKDHNTFQKMGEGLSSAFGGGKKKKLQKMSGELKQEQGRLDEARAGLKEREKFLEHSYQVMQEAVANLKDSIDRIKKSINQIKAIWNAKASAQDQI